MKKRLLIFQLLILVASCSFSQGVGIGTTTPDPSAALDITATNKGLLIPRMNINSINAIVSPARGLLVYDSVANQLMMNIGTPAVPNWQAVAGNLRTLAPSGSGNTWNLNGNSGNDPANQFLGTTDIQPLRIRINNIQAGELHPASGNISWGLRAGGADSLGFNNIAIGTDALKSNTNISSLVAIGDSALFNTKQNTPGSNEGTFNTAIGSKSLFSNITGASNTATGNRSLFSNTTGDNNTAIGSSSLFKNTTGSSNTAVGNSSLSSNNTGSFNVATGDQSLFSNTTGARNIAAGFQSLRKNTTGVFNVATGDQSLFSNTTGARNTATGGRSLINNTTGNNNTATGFESLGANTTGSNNIAVGPGSLSSNTTGFSNIAIGTDALKSGTTQINLVAIGDSALFHNGVGGSSSLHSAFNTAIGSKSLFSNTTGFNNTAAGSQSLLNNTTGARNTATGGQSLISNITGGENTATGFQSLFSNINGFNNTATGDQSLFSNTMGNENTACGVFSLFSNTTGGANTSVGYFSLVGNTTGFSNTAVGDFALQRNTTGNENTAVGNGALSSNTGNLGQFNTAVGSRALSGPSGSEFNTAVGYLSGANHNIGFNNTMVGAHADVLFDGIFNSVALGESSLCTGSNQVRFGNSSTTSIGGIVGYSNLSDGRYKKKVQENVKGIDFIMKLRPVTYQLDMMGINKKLNSNAAGKTGDQSKKNTEENGKTIFSGFVAQEVEQAAKDAGYDFSGVDKPKNENDMYGLRYSEFVVPLVKAMQEQQQMINDLRKQNADLQKMVLDLGKKVK